MPEEFEQPDMPSEDEAVVASDAGVDEETPREAAATRTTGGDPVAGVLLITALALIAVLLATGGLVFIYLNTLNDAPRTRVERDMNVWETAVKERPDDVNAWANLAYSYAEAGEFDRAMDTLRRARRVTDKDEFVIVEADILRASGRYTEAVEAYGRAELAVIRIQKELETERKKVGVNIQEDNSALSRVYYGRGLSHEKLGATDAAIEDVRRALKLEPQAATMWTTLGDLYAGSKETSAAEDAYRKALTFVPDEPGALEGLQRLEEPSK